MGNPLLVVARWESKRGRRWVEVTRAANGTFQWRSSDRTTRVGYITLAECAARAAIEAAMMPGAALTRTA